MGSWQRQVQEQAMAGSCPIPLPPETARCSTHTHLACLGVVNV